MPNIHLKILTLLKIYNLAASAIILLQFNIESKKVLLIKFNPTLDPWP